MGSQWVDGSPSWESIGTNLAGSITGAPNKALQGISAADQIWINRREEQRKKAEFDAAVAAGTAGANALPTNPIATTPYDAIGPMIGDVNNPAQTAGIPRQSLTYAGPEDVARAERDRLFFGNTIKAAAYKHPGELPGLYAKGSVGVSGVPKTPAEIARLEFMTKGQVDRTKPDNYVAVDPTSGNVVRVLGAGDGVYAADGVTKLSDIAPPGSIISKAGETQLNAKPRTMMDDAASRQNALLDATIAIGKGQPPDPAQTTRLEYALRTEYPAINKVMTTALGDSQILHNFVETMPPGPLKPLLDHIAKTNYPLAVAPTAAPGSVFSTGASPVTTASSGGLVGTPTAAAAVPPGEPILPGYDPNAPVQTTTLTERPATEAQVKLSQALSAVSNERATIEQLMNVQRGPDGKPTVPPGAYTPSWTASIVRDSAGTAGIPGKILNAMDPNARAYFIAGRAWVEPVLRIATGAVAPVEEVVDYMQRFIPDANDNDAMKAMKLTRMRVWEGAARKAATAGSALDMIIKDPETDPEARKMAESFRVKAYENNTLNTPKEHLPPTPSRGGSSAPGSSGRGTYTPPPEAGRSAKDIIRGQ